MNVIIWNWGIKQLKECSKHKDRLYKMPKTQLYWGHRSHPSRAALLSARLPHHGTGEYFWGALFANALFPFWTSTHLMLFPLNSYLREQTGEQRRISHSENHDCLLIISRPALCVWETAEEGEPGKRGEGGRETFPKASKALEARREGRSLDGGLRWSVTGCSQGGNGCV